MIFSINAINMSKGIPAIPYRTLVYCFDVSFFFSSRRRHTRCSGDWSSDVCSSDLPGEHVGKPSLRIDAIEPGSLDQRVNGGGAAAAFVGAGKGPVLAAECNSAQLALGSVVGHAQPAIVDEAREHLPALEAVVDRLRGLALAGELGASLAQEGVKLIDEGAATRITRGFALVRRQAVDVALDRKQRIDLFDGLDRDRCFLQSRDLEQLAPCMRPAADLGDRTRLARRLIEPVEAGI